MVPIVIEATQAGNADWAAATPKTNSITVTKAVAGLIFTNLVQVYDGRQHPVSAVTAPTGLTVVITYDGGSTPPTDLGQYAITGTVNDVMYQGTASDTLSIEEPSRILSLSRLA